MEKQNVYCFIKNDEIPIIKFETCCLPRVGETLLIGINRYVVEKIEHRFREDYSYCKHEVVIILG